MPSLKLHLDADTSIKALHSALLARGHDVTRTPTPRCQRMSAIKLSFCKQQPRADVFLPLT